MPELKVDFKSLGPIRLLPLDTSNLFLPFGRPVADYVRGVAGVENGLRKMSRQGWLEFPAAISWSSVESSLTTTGFDDEAAAAAEEVETIEAGGEITPPVAGFMEWFDGAGPRDIELRDGKAKPARNVQLAVLAQAQVKFPRVTELPLRPRMTFAPHPALGKSKSTAKSGPVLVTKPATVAPPVKPAAPAPPPPATKAAAPPKIETPAAQKTAPPLSPVESVTPKVAAPKPSIPEPAAPPQKVGPPPKTAAPATKAPAALKPEGIKSSPRVAAKLEPPAPRIEAKLEPKPEVRHEALKPDPAPEIPARPLEARPSGSVVERDLSFGQPQSSGGMPTLVKVAIPAVLLLAGVGYYLFGTGSSKPATQKAPQAITMGEQGWVTEWASDTVGSRRARQITLYRPSMKLTDYKFEFTGTIESKALGWVFRAADTNNYYGMKIEIARPGPTPSLMISRFAVVEGRESSVSQKPLPIMAQSTTSFNVKLDVSGPRFTVYVQGQPVDVWTDNRLKQGAVGFMNEREERARTSSVHFSYPAAGGN